MPSPFPGMNPYLEHPAVWNDFHNTFAVFLREGLLPGVRPHYFIRLDEQLFVRDEPDEGRHLLGRGDAVLTGRGAPIAGAALLTASVEVSVPIRDIERQAFLEVRDRDDRSVVTVIEVLSPSNKAAGPDREQYHTKREQLLRSGVHFVEIDLLRGGRRADMDGLPPCDYYAAVCRFERRPAATYPVRLRERLPVVGVPLRGAAEAPLDLQPALHAAYDSGAFGDSIYAQELSPRLSQADAAWAAAFVPPT